MTLIDGDEDALENPPKYTRDDLKRNILLLEMLVV